MWVSRHNAPFMIGPGPVERRLSTRHLRRLQHRLQRECHEASVAGRVVDVEASVAGDQRHRLDWPEAALAAEDPHAFEASAPRTSNRALPKRSSAGGRVEDAGATTRRAEPTPPPRRGVGQIDSRRAPQAHVPPRKAHPSLGRRPADQWDVWHPAATGAARRRRAPAARRQLRTAAAPRRPLRGVRQSTTLPPPTAFARRRLRTASSTVRPAPNEIERPVRSRNQEASS